MARSLTRFILSQKHRLPGILLLVLLLSALSCITAATGSPDTTCPSQVSDTEYHHLEAFYTDLHQHPELSGLEMNTSAKIAGELRDAGYRVTDHVGGYGVVGVLENGNGPVIGLRGDMDALPVTEKTGLPYTSIVMTSWDNQTGIGVMRMPAATTRTAQSWS